MIAKANKHVNSRPSGMGDRNHAQSGPETRQAPPGSWSRSPRGDARGQHKLHNHVQHWGRRARPGAEDAATAAPG